MNIEEAISKSIVYDAGSEYRFRVDGYVFRHRYMTGSTDSEKCPKRVAGEYIVEEAGE